MTASYWKSRITAALAINVTQLARNDERETLINAVKLPSAAVDGVFPEQIKLMRQTVVEVNEALNVSGAAFRSAMQNLVALKLNIPHGNWRAFCKSGALNYSEKAVSDLVNAYIKWIGTDEGKDVKDYVLVSMSPRTLCAVANAPIEVRNEVQSRVIGGNLVTEAEVRKLIGSAKRRTAEQKALTEANKVISNTEKGYATDDTKEDVKQKMRTMAEKYQSLVKASKAMDSALASLYELEELDQEDKLFELYQSKLSEQDSKKKLSPKAVDFLFKLREMDIPVEMEKAKEVKEKFQAKLTEEVEKRGVEVKE